MKLAEVLSELKLLEDEKIRAVNLRRGDDHAENAPARLQWEMNNCLANIGIHHPELRARALAIGENLQVLKDYPTPPNCTSPYAPIWINEMVRRQERT